MESELPENIWFVRSNGGFGSIPVRPEGWRVIKVFVAGIVVSVLLAAFLAALGPTWLWVVVFAIGMAASAWYFISTARRHTDYAITINDFFMANRGRAKQPRKTETEMGNLR